MKRIVVEVTTDDIADGVPRDSFRCPLARAIVRVIGPEVSVGVTTITRYLDEDPYVVMVPMTKRARAFRERVDNDKPVKPTTFTFLVPEAMLT